MAKNLFLTINENVVKQIKESDEDVKLDVKNLAYKNIEIITPNYLTTIESMLETRPEVRDIPSEMAYLKFFMSLPYKITVKKIDVNTLKISVAVIAPKATQVMVDYTLNAVDDSTCDVVHGVDSQGGIEAVECTTLFIGKLLNYLDRPTTVKEVHSVKEPKTSSKKKKKAGKKKSPVQYVYKTVCKVTNITVEKSTGTRRNMTEREYNKEEWERRGHFRTYRDKHTGEIKKRVWINSTTCHARGKIKTNQHMKITRID